MRYKLIASILLIGSLLVSILIFLGLYVQGPRDTLSNSLHEHRRLSDDNNASPDVTASQKLESSPESHTDVLQTIDILVKSPRLDRDTVKSLNARQTLKVLYSLYDDANYCHSWGRVSLIIGHLGRSAESSKVLTEFFTRSEDHHKVPAAYEIYSDKAATLVRLGIVADSAGVSFLQNAMTLDGATKHARKWGESLRDVPHDFEWEDLVPLIRGKAAMGLVFTFDPVNVDSVRKVYNETAAAYQGVVAASGESNSDSDRPSSDDQARVYDLFALLVDAMANAELTDDIGVERYTELSLNMHQYIELITPYVETYSMDIH